MQAGTDVRRPVLSAPASESKTDKRKGRIILAGRGENVRLAAAVRFRLAIDAPKIAAAISPAARPPLGSSAVPGKPCTASSIQQRYLGLGALPIAASSSHGEMSDTGEATAAERAMKPPAEEEKIPAEEAHADPLEEKLGPVATLVRRPLHSFTWIH